MSYAQAMRWQRTHRKGTRQPVLMHTGSGFWPARSWVLHEWQPYVQACVALGVEPFACETFYGASLRGHIMSGLDPGNAASYTKARRDAGFTSHNDTRAT